MEDDEEESCSIQPVCPSPAPFIVLHCVMIDHCLYQGIDDVTVITHVMEKQSEYMKLLFTRHFEIDIAVPILVLIWLLLNTACPMSSSVHSLSVSSVLDVSEFGSTR